MPTLRLVLRALTAFHETRPLEPECLFARQRTRCFDAVDDLPWRELTTRLAFDTAAKLLEQLGAHVGDPVIP
jgi:hypothetical protein